GGGDLLRRALDLLAALDAAWSGHHRHALAADLQAADLYDRALRAEAPAGELVGRDDAVGFFHAFHHFEDLEIELVLSADAAQHRVHDPRRAVHVEPHLDHALDDRVDLGLGRALLHHD